MEHQCTPKQKIPKWNILVFQNKKITSWTLINSLFVCPVQKNTEWNILIFKNKKSRHGHWLIPCLYVLLFQRWWLEWWWKWFRLRQYAQTWRIFTFWNHTSMQFWFQTSHQCMPILRNVPIIPSRLIYTWRCTPMF